MTKKNQKILYDHFIAIANDGKYKASVRENAKLHAEQILENYPGIKVTQEEKTKVKK